MDSNGITGYPHDGRPDKRQRMLDDLSGSLAIHPDLQITSAVALQNFASGQHNESRHPPAINQNEAAKKRASIAVLLGLINGEAAADCISARSAGRRRQGQRRTFATWLMSLTFL